MNAIHKTICAGLVLATTAGAAPLRAEDVPQDAAAQRESALQINQANELLRGGNVEGALGAYKQAEEFAPESADLSYNMAVAQYRKGDVAAAEPLFRAAATSENDTLAARSRYNLGNCDYTSGLQLAEKDRPAAIEKLESAITNYRSALDVDGTDADARTNIELASQLIEKLRQEEKEQQQKQQEQQQKQQEQNQQDQQNQQQDQQQQDQKQQNDQKQNQDQKQDQKQNEQQQNEQQQSQSSQGEKNKDQQSQDQQKQDEQSKQNEKSQQGEQSKQDQKSEQQKQQDAEQQEQDQQSKQDKSDESKEDQKQSESEQQSESQQQSESEQKPGDKNEQQPAQQKSQQQKQNQPQRDQQPSAADAKPEKEGKAAPKGELNAAGQEDAKPGDKKQEVRAFDPSKDGEMTQQEAEKMLQAIRDRDMIRRYQREAAERSQYEPVDRDW